MPDLKTDEGLRQALHEIAAWGRPSAPVIPRDSPAPSPLPAEVV